MSYIQILKFQKEDSQRNNSTCLPELESNINRIREVQQVVSKQKRPTPRSLLRNCLNARNKEINPEMGEVLIRISGKAKLPNCPPE